MSGSELSPSSPEDFHYDAFISYSNKDREWVHCSLLPFLEHNGLRVCIDKRDFEIGAPSLVNMENAVERSRKTLLVLTPNWVNSEWTNFEAILVQTKDPAGRRRRTLPLMLESCTLPERLQALTYLDLTEPSQRDIQLRRLIGAIRDIPASPVITLSTRAPLPELPKNPFEATLAIRDPLHFVGRDTEMRMLKNTLMGGSVALIGAPKVGKSSLLWQLTTNWSGKMLGPLDCMMIDGRDDLYAFIANALGGLDGTVDWRAVRQALLHTEALLLIDELDAGPSSGLSYEDITRFRAVCDANRQFKMVVVSRRPLREVYPDTGNGSPAYNFLVPLTLNVFDDADAMTLLSHPWAPAAPLFEAEISHQLLLMTGKHPFKLQRAAFHRYLAMSNSSYDWRRAYQQDMEHML